MTPQAGDLYSIEGQTVFPTYCTKGGSSSPNLISSPCFSSGGNVKIQCVDIRYRWDGWDWVAEIVDGTEREYTR